eukprot:7523300-Pyramimonas_sp.AAC.1
MEFASPADEFASPADEFTSPADEFTSPADEFTSSAAEFTSSAAEFTLRLRLRQSSVTRIQPLLGSSVGDTSAVKGAAHSHELGWSLLLTKPSARRCLPSAQWLRLWCLWASSCVHRMRCAVLYCAVLSCTAPAFQLTGR